MAAEKGKTAGDPWCLGYFVDNEIALGRRDLAGRGRAGLAGRPGRQEGLRRGPEGQVRRRSRSSTRPGARSTPRGTPCLQSRDAPDTKKARDDLRPSTRKTAEQYFRLCREAVKEVAPDQLYLGCRFAWVQRPGRPRPPPSSATWSASTSTAAAWPDFRLPEGVDMPVIIGEFHFGALDRGMFHTGLVPTENQEERAAGLQELRARAPWATRRSSARTGSSTRDQATTGRGDGENYQIGFVDICDTPYPETIQAVREVGYGMYKYRLGRVEVKVVWERNVGDAATPQFKFKNVPSPSKTDAATKAKFTIVAGAKRPQRRRRGRPQRRRPAERGGPARRELLLRRRQRGRPAPGGPGEVTEVKQVKHVLVAREHPRAAGLQALRQRRIGQGLQRQARPGALRRRRRAGSSSRRSTRGPRTASPAGNTAWRSPTRPPARWPSAATSCSTFPGPKTPTRSATRSLARST